MVKMMCSTDKEDERRHETFNYAVMMQEILSWSCAVPRRRHALPSRTSVAYSQMTWLLAINLNRNMMRTEHPGVAYVSLS